MFVVKVLWYVLRLIVVLMLVVFVSEVILFSGYWKIELVLLVLYVFV